METLTGLINKLQELFGDNIKTTDCLKNNGNISDVPRGLQIFYKQYSSISTPFGSIYTLETAKKMSSYEPFNSEGWFCFGQDNYGFVFWLCKDTKEGEPCFIEWDHDINSKIDEAFDTSLQEFIQRIESDFEDNETCSISIKSCIEDSISELMKIKKAFNLQLSLSELREIPQNLPYEISDEYLYVKALRIVKELNLKKVKLEIFHVQS